MTTEPIAPATPETHDVVVVGGGIGGLSVAQALAAKGLRVRVLEVAPEFGEVGAGLQLAPNCTRILDFYGLLDEAKSLGVLPKRMVMRDAVDGSELSHLDLVELEARYGSPYMVIHRSDLHAIFLRACQRAGVELLNDQKVVDYDSGEGHGSAILADGRVDSAPLVIAADGIHSPARYKYVGDQPQSSAYVAYRGTRPIAEGEEPAFDLDEVGVYVGPQCHFVHYGLRGGGMLNQVAVFESPKALAGVEDWGTPDELDGAFAQCTEKVTENLAYMWRDKWWRMYDRLPIDDWVFGNVVLLGDSAHAPLQYIAQGAIMAIQDGYVLSEHAARHATSNPDGTVSVDWKPVFDAYNAVRPAHCRNVLQTSRKWGELWHVDGDLRLARNAVMRARDVHDYSFIDWLYTNTPLTPDEVLPLFTPVPLKA